MTSKTKLSILIPVRNEGANLKVILRILPAILDVKHEILVIYYSLNYNIIPLINSMGMMHPGIKGVHNQLGKGVMNAFLSGISKSKGDYILLTPADDIGPVLAIGDMISLMNKGCQLVSCTRYSHGGRVLGGSAIGRPLSRIANRIFYWLSCSAFTDSTVGIKMMRRDILDKIKLESNPVGFAFAFELAIKAQINGMKLGEVPIVSLNRLSGKSSFAFGSWVREYSRWFYYGMKNYARLKNTRKNVVMRAPAHL